MCLLVLLVTILIFLITPFLLYREISDYCPLSVKSMLDKCGK